MPFIRPTRSAIVALAIVILFAPATLLAQRTPRSSGIDTTNLDRSVRPQDDFFHFVNGGWLKRTEIPADASSWGAFGKVREDSRNTLHEIAEQAMKSNAPAGSERRKIADLYASYMDSARIESLGIQPLSAELKVIASINDVAQVPAAFAEFRKLVTSAPYFGGGSSSSPPIVLSVGPDAKHSKVNIVMLSQGGLGLPDRDYYLAKGKEMDAARAGYASYITRLMTLAKQSDASGAALRIIEMETAIAQQHWERARLRDRNAVYNRMTVEELRTLVPGFNWKSYLAAAGVPNASEVIVGQPDYVKAFSDILAATPVATWREYLTFKLLDDYAFDLPAEFVQAKYEFRENLLSGRSAAPMRWKRGVNKVDASLGEAAGKLYVAQKFPPAAKVRMNELVHNIIASYRVGIDSLDWMAPVTKVAAKEKLSKFSIKIGYPDKWRDFSGLEIRKGDVVGNSIRASRFYYNDMIAQLGKPVDRTTWGMTPQTVNAQYNASKNEILFPAGILQPPFFNAKADDAVNYGAIGSVIGHEIGHGFDDQGRKMDGDGNLRDWWTAGDAGNFDARATALGAQYAAINPIGDLHINPKLTMGENIGDLSGVAAAYRAYRISLGKKQPRVISGFTGDQRFFIGMATVWQNKAREAALRQQLLTDPHSPSAARGFVPLVNNDMFMQAFNVKAGDGMYRAPADRVKIW